MYAWAASSIRKDPTLQMQDLRNVPGCSRGAIKHSYTSLLPGSELQNQYASSRGNYITTLHIAKIYCKMHYMGKSIILQRCANLHKSLEGGHGRSPPESFMLMGDP